MNRHAIVPRGLDFTAVTHGDARTAGRSATYLPECWCSLHKLTSSSLIKFDVSERTVSSLWATPEQTDVIHTTVLRWMLVLLSLCQRGLSSTLASSGLGGSVVLWEGHTFFFTVNADVACGFHGLSKWRNGLWKNSPAPQRPASLKKPSSFWWDFFVSLDLM